MLQGVRRVVAERAFRARLEAMRSAPAIEPGNEDRVKNTWGHQTTEPSRNCARLHQASLHDFVFEVQLRRAQKDKSGGNQQKRKTAKNHQERQLLVVQLDGINVHNFLDVVRIRRV